MLGDKDSKQLNFKNEYSSGILSPISYEVKIDVEVMEKIDLKFTNIPKLIDIKNDLDMENSTKWYAISLS